MPQKPTKTQVSNRALEMIMRDVLEGMEELSLRIGSDFPADTQATTRLIDTTLQFPKTEIVYFPQPLRQSA